MLNRKQFFLHSFQVIITITVSILSAFYINLITNQYPLEEGKLFKDVFESLDYYNAIPIVIIFLILVQIVISVRPYRNLGMIQDILVKKILETSSKSLIHPHETRHIRAIITLTDLSDKNNPKRRTAYTYNAEADPERHGVYPLDFGITGEAFRTKSVIVKELPQAHHEEYDEDLKRNVLPQIRTIMAAPIYCDNDLPIGILAFDTTLSLNTVKFNSFQARSIAQSWADIIGYIIGKTRG